MKISQARLNTLKAIKASAFNDAVKRDMKRQFFADLKNDADLDQDDHIKVGMETGTLYVRRPATGTVWVEA